MESSSQLECQVCNRKFSKTCALSAHNKSKYHLDNVALNSRIHPAGEAESPITSVAGSSRRGVKRAHMDLVSDPVIPVECLACGTSFDNVNYLHRHENTLEHAKKIMEGQLYGEDFDPNFAVFKGVSALQNRYATFVICEKSGTDKTKQIDEVLNSMLPVLKKLCFFNLKEKSSLKIQLKCIISIRRWVVLKNKEESSDVINNEYRKELSEPFVITLRSKQYHIFRFSSLSLNDVIDTRMFGDIKNNYENISTSGSDWVYDGFKWGELVISKYNVAKSGSYIPLPTELEKMHGM